MSETEELDIVYKYLKSGADHFLLKPLTEDVIRGLWQTIYRHRRESIVLSKLGEEQSRTSKLEEKNITLQAEIEKLKKQVEEAVELPVRIITKEAENLFSSANLPADIILSTILKQLKSVDLYQNAFAKLLADSSDIEPMTKRWLLDELSTEGVSRVSNRLGYKPEDWPQDNESKSDELLRDPDFDVWSYSEEQLLPLCEDVLNHFGLIDRFKISREKLRHFLSDVSWNYSKQNPYHNFRHAFDVMQTTFLLLTNMNASSLLNYLEIFAILIAALVHDLGHPALNNTFQVVTGSNLALTYNDQSVLENYHCALAFTLLRKPENDILESFTQEEKAKVRKIIIQTVLATDLASHMEIMAKWNATANQFSKDDEKHRLLFLQILLKGSDIANPGKTFDQAKYWATLVQEEFFRQVTA